MVLIPRVIHIVWIGPNPYPFTTDQNSWLRHNPDWELRFWTNDNLPKLVNRKIFDLIPTWAGKADILRYEILYRQGGLYVDADSYCTRPLAPLIENLTCFSMTSNSGKRVCNAVLGTVRNHPAYAKIVHGLEQHIERIRKRQKREQRAFSLHHLTGSFYISPVLMASPDFIRLDDGAKAGTRKYFCSLKDPTDDAYIIQRHKQTWRRDETGKLSDGCFLV